MWQQNLSWQQGLFSEVSISRLRGIRSTTEYDPTLAVYERFNSKNGNNWQNLKLKRILSPKGESIGVLENLFSGGYYVVAIDTRLRSFSFSCPFITQQSIQGSVDLTIEYEVKNTQLLMRVEDPLLALQKRVEQTVQDRAFDLGYPRLTSTDIRRQLLNLETEREIGIVLYNPLCGAIQWPKEIKDITSQPILDTLKFQNQDDRNSYRIKKLANIGITDPLVVASVLSREDSDFQVIVEHIQNFARNAQNQFDTQLKLLEWMSDRDYITRSDARRLITPLLDKINAGSLPGGSVSSFLTGGNDTAPKQITSHNDTISGQVSTPSSGNQPNVTRRRVVDTSSSEDSSDKSSNDNANTSVVSRRRRVSFSDDNQTD